MHTIILLIWFITGGPNGNELKIQPYATLEDCRAAGDVLNDLSTKAKETKAIADFGGVCFEVPGAVGGSI